MQITFECSLRKAPTKKFTWGGVNGVTTLEDMLKTIRSMGLRPSDVVVHGLRYEYEHGSMSYTM